MCVWWNFLRESAILLSRKRRVNVFMKLFFLPSLFFGRNRSREKNFSNSYYKNERILRSTASVTRSFAQRCNYYTGYNSKLTSFLSVLVLNEKWIIQQQARVITSFLSVNIVKNLLKPPKWSNSSKQHDTKRKKSEGEKKKKTKKEERNKNDGSSLKLNKSLLLLLLLVFCLDLIVFLKNYLRNL